MHRSDVRVHKTGPTADDPGRSHRINPDGLRRSADRAAAHPGVSAPRHNRLSSEEVDAQIRQFFAADEN